MIISVSTQDTYNWPQTSAARGKRVHARLPHGRLGHVDDDRRVPGLVFNRASGRIDKRCAAVCCHTVAL